MSSIIVRLSVGEAALNVYADHALKEFLNLQQKWKCKKSCNDCRLCWISSELSDFAQSCSTNISEMSWEQRLSQILAMECLAECWAFARSIENVRQADKHALCEYLSKFAGYYQARSNCSGGSSTAEGNGKAEWVFTSHFCELIVKRIQSGVGLRHIWQKVNTCPEACNALAPCLGYAPQIADVQDTYIRLIQINILLNANELARQELVIERRILTECVTTRSLSRYKASNSSEKTLMCEHLQHWCERVFAAREV